MSETIRLADYFYLQCPDRPGEGARALSQLKDAGINPLAFSAFPAGRQRTQLDFVPENPAAFRAAARRAGWKLTGPKKIFHIAGEDRVGVMADVVSKLAAPKINITAMQAVGAGTGWVGALLLVAPRDVEPAAKAVRTGQQVGGWR